MIWRMCNLLFGWDYVAWKNSAAQGVARVFKASDSEKAFYFRHKLTKVVDVIEIKEQVVWMTCDPKKYGY